MGTTATPAEATPAEQAPAVAVKPALRPRDGSIQASLARLGINLSRRQLIGVGVSLVAGVVTSRVLPYVYPVLSPALDVVFGPGPSGPRDQFNSMMMTAITFASSFVISFIASRTGRNT